jgi:hypothetical protein
MVLACLQHVRAECAFVMAPRMCTLGSGHSRSSILDWNLPKGECYCGSESVVWLSVPGAEHADKAGNELTLLEMGCSEECLHEDRTLQEVLALVKLPFQCCHTA